MSEEHIASIFRVKYTEQDTSVKADGKIIFFIVTAVRTSIPT
jgi:hypothetical protein